MNIKNVKSYLTGRHNAWLNSIDDTELRSELKKNSLIAGGAIASLMQGETPNDIDIYLSDPEVALKMVVYYIQKWNNDERHTRKIGLRLKANKAVQLKDKEQQALIDIILDNQHEEHSEEELLGMNNEKLADIIESYNYAGNYDIVYDDFSDIKVRDLYRINEQANGVSLFISSSGVASENTEVPDDGMPASAGIAGNEGSTATKENEKPDYRPVFLTDNAISLKGKVQIVLRFIGEPEEITANFDYVHCTCTYVPYTKELTLPSQALASMMTKELVYVGSRYPICSLFRMRKFIHRGYYINVGQILKMVFQIKSLDLSNLIVMEDQLLGVDSAYMSSFIEQIKKDAKEGTEVTETYLLGVISDMFDTELSN